MSYDYNYIRSKIRYWNAQLDMAQQGAHEDSYRQGLSGVYNSDRYTPRYNNSYYKFINRRSMNNRINRRNNGY